MLRTEQNTQRVERAVRRAAREAGLGTRLQTDFEHGQWWVTNLATGAQWSAIDSNDPSGFSFEQVTRGEE